MRLRLLLIACLFAALPAAASAQGKVRTLNTDTGSIRVTIVTDRLEHPWGVAFLPDGRMLVTERPGRLRIVTAEGEVSAPVKGVPKVFAQGQGGFLDVALDPNFADNRLVYLSFAEPGPGGASTAVARAKFENDALTGVTVIFRQEPKVSGGNHFGSRLAFAPDGNLFVTTGERFEFEPAQDLSVDLGKIVRIRPDGKIPDDNPFVGQKNARPEIWSYGHRNVEGAAINPETGVLWAHEMGPRGGDELNIPQAGKNYGWPLVSWGRHYDGRPIPDPPTRPDLAGSIRHWTPVISPSGMAFYTGSLLPAWRGNLLIGGLTARGIVRLTLDGEKVTGEERISLGARTRDVRQGTDGAVYALTDEENGKLLRIEPARAPE
ncbi:PQQ-dependent oxidoreductase, gdhB family [Rhodovulum sp. PH10]|uniref:PQQ-dependent sugar dehydrogenase n=1 Tax=Rhodovulum sp. PH10 TaxID=1187851 RepID=UPI00027C1F50|nr:PQQ-dependent sugar dehydrogenase [Rhodovulum sp. PH10]EJW09386.1 PQQ-dependent oxidoreductase, gdhB family [Rhodovulum sp. PH10]